jgi:hypothetical protein
LRGGHPLVSLAFACTALKLHDFKQKGAKGVGSPQFAECFELFHRAAPRERGMCRTKKKGPDT